MSGYIFYFEKDFLNKTKALTALTNTATVMSLFVDLCGIIRNDCAKGQRKMRPKDDKKLLRIIQKKNLNFEHMNLYHFYSIFFL